MEKKRLYLDHDGTLTYMIEGRNGRTKEKYKKDLKEFINFINENFEVIWCSGCSHSEIVYNLLKEGISSEILDKIPYLEYDFAYEKSRSIIEETTDFIFIDDDCNRSEEDYLRKRGLQGNLIKADPYNENDLSRIKKIL